MPLNTRGSEGGGGLLLNADGEAGYGADLAPKATDEEESAQDYRMHRFTHVLVNIRRSRRSSGLFNEQGIRPLANLMGVGGIGLAVHGDAGHRQHHGQDVSDQRRHGLAGIVVSVSFVLRRRLGFVRFFSATSS